MKKVLLAGTVCLIVGIGIAYGIAAKSASTTTPSASAKTSVVQLPTAKSLLALVNKERVRNGVKPLKIDERLNTSAQLKAIDEVKYSYFGHISPNSSPYAGTHGYRLIDGTGLRCIFESENITQGTVNDPNTAENDVNAWINSPPHHKAMIDPRFTLTGFGIKGEEAVEHFCQTS